MHMPVAKKTTATSRHRLVETAATTNTPAVMKRAVTARQTAAAETPPTQEPTLTPIVKV